jgi:hypothetical protein
MTNKTVRPIMTVEARDVLDKIHENVNSETRSESIEWFWIRHINLLSQRDSLCIDKSMLTSRIAHGKAARTKLKREVSKYKVISGFMTAACVALIATMMITAS